MGVSKKKVLVIEDNEDLQEIYRVYLEEAGFEVLDVIKNQSSFGGPIIVCSNLSQERDVKKAYELGADLYLKKSDFTGKQVADKVIEFMKLKNII